jgi:hypothetical protein
MARRHSIQDDDDSGEVWREYRREQQQRRTDRLGPRSDEIRALAGQGFTVREMTAYQFRVDGALDLYPIHRRYHLIKSGKRGGYRSAAEIAGRLLRRGR